MPLRRAAVCVIWFLFHKAVTYNAGLGQEVEALKAEHGAAATRAALTLEHRSLCAREKGTRAELLGLTAVGLGRFKQPAAETSQLKARSTRCIPAPCCSTQCRKQLWAAELQVVAVAMQNYSTSDAACTYLTPK